MLTTKERLATLEAENEAAKPHHEKTSKDIGEISNRLTAIETKLEFLVNGRGNGAWGRAKVVAGPSVMGGGTIGLLWLALERFS